MSVPERSETDAAVDRIRSVTRTMARYIQTSKRAHGRLVPQTSEIGRLLEESVREIRTQHPDSARVNLAAEKFYHVLNGPTSPNEGE